MLHYMHPQENSTTVQRSQQQQTSTRAVSAGSIPHNTDAPAKASVSRATADSETVSMKEHKELFSEYKKQDKFIHELSYQNELNKDRASKYKQTLKARLEDMKALQAKVDKYRAQAKSLETSKGKDGSSKALSECKSKLAATTKELAEANKELQSLKSELPQVKALLSKGGQAIQQLAAETKRNQELQQQVAELMTQTRSKNNKASPAGTDISDPALKAKNQQLQSEVVAVKDKLKAASQEVSARVSQVALCKDMLTKAEEVLRTCSELHESKGGALASALRETTANVQSFLQNLARSNSSTSASGQ